MENHTNQLIVKGINEGLMLILPEGEWEVVCSDIKERINSQSTFFKGADVYIDVASRDLRVSEIADLRDLFGSFEIRMRGLLSFSEITQKNADPKFMCNSERAFWNDPKNMITPYNIIFSINSIFIRSGIIYITKITSFK